MFKYTSEYPIPERQCIYNISRILKVPQSIAHLRMNYGCGLQVSTIFVSVVIWVGTIDVAVEPRVVHAGG